MILDTTTPLSFPGNSLEAEGKQSLKAKEIELQVLAGSAFLTFSKTEIWCLQLKYQLEMSTMTTNVGKTISPVTVSDSHFPLGFGHKTAWQNSCCSYIKTSSPQAQIFQSFFLLHFS